MNESKFWKIIQSARTVGDRWNMRALGGAVLEILTQQPTSEILAFDHTFNMLMDRSYQADLWDAADVIACGCSDDGFIDFRAWLISQGQRVFEDALKNPDTLANVISPQMRNATLNGLLSAVAWDAHTYKTRQPIPDRRYQMPSLKGQRADWEQRKSKFPRLVSQLRECNPLPHSNPPAIPSPIYGIYEFADETNGGKWYVGGSTSVSLKTRLEQHRLKGRFSTWDKVVWTPVAITEFVDIAERIRMEQIAFMQGVSKSANVSLTVTYHPASNERVKLFFEQKLWKQMPDWPKWLYPPATYSKRIGLSEEDPDFA